jgi:hypothetical protein
MTQVYCELTEDSAKRLKLPRYVHYNTNQTLKNSGSHMYIFEADRVWVQHGTVVRFDKHRWKDLKTVKVDMEEFMWIKLKSVEI